MDEINSYIDIKQLLNKSSKQNIMLLIDTIKENPELAEHLYNLSIANKHPYSWRAAWAMVHLCNAEPNTLRLFTNRMIKDIGSLQTGRQVVSFLQILTKIDFPKQDGGQLFDLSIGILLDAKQKMSFKLYALLFLEKFIKKVPELIPELLLTIEDEELISDNKYIRKRIYSLKKNLSNPIK